MEPKKIDPREVDQKLMEELAIDQDYLDWLDYLDVMLSDQMDQDVMIELKYSQ